MEKLIYVIWKRAEQSIGSFKETMLGEAQGEIPFLDGHPISEALGGAAHQSGDGLLA